MTTKHYMTRDLYKGSWKDVLAKYESLTTENGKAKMKPRFVAEGSAIKHLDKIGEVLGKVKEQHNIPMTQSNASNATSTPRRYPVFEIIEVRTIRRACPTSEDVIKWREGASVDDLDLHTVAASYRIVEVTHGNSEVENDMFKRAEMSPPRDPPTPIPVVDNNVEMTTPPITKEVTTTTIPSEFTTSINVKEVPPVESPTIQ